METNSTKSTLKIFVSHDKDDSHITMFAVRLRVILNNRNFMAKDSFVLFLSLGVRGFGVGVLRVQVTFLQTGK